MEYVPHPGHLRQGYHGPWLITGELGVPLSKSQDGWLENSAPNQIHAAVGNVSSKGQLQGDALQADPCAGQITRRCRSLSAPA